MNSDNPSGGDDQQGRPRCSLTPDYVAGFIDGEGCFSVSVHPHPSVRHPKRWLLGPCFQAYQHRDNVGILEALHEFFGCGRISAKGPKSSVMTCSVYRRRDLESVIVPFFEARPLISRKQEDFLKFAEIVRMMQRKEHQTCGGFRRIVELAFSMNQHGKQRRYSFEEVMAEPSETVRQGSASESTKIQSDPHSDMGRAAEMPAPLLDLASGTGESSGSNKRA
jgi:LAGLIDADG endonuclease